MPKLAILGLSHNIIEGPLDPTWGTTGGLRALAIIEASYNKLNGTLPAEWADNLYQMFYVELQHNNLEGIHKLRPP